MRNNKDHHFMVHKQHHYREYKDQFNQNMRFIMLGNIIILLIMCVYALVN